MRFLFCFLMVLFCVNSLSSTLPVIGSNGVIPSNSSTLPLDNGESFTGKWVDVSKLPFFSVAVKTDQNGYFSVQYSPDCENQDSTLTRYYNTADIEAPHVFVNARKCARISFTNDSGSNQTYFRLQTMGGSRGQLNSPLDSILARDFDATAVRPTDFHAEVALGRRQGAATWNKFGYNTDVDTATDPEILASWGGTFQFLTAGETITIVSSSTADDGDPAGTGVNSIVVYGVDSSWNTATEVFTMDGTTNVVSTSSWIGINRIAVFLSGSGQSNAGTITITATTSGYTLAEMPLGGAVSQQCVFYVPDNHQFLAEWLHLDVLKISGGGGDPEATIKGWVYSAVNNTSQEIYRGHIDTSNENNLNVAPPLPFPISEKTIFYITGETDKDNTSITCRFSGELMADPNS